MQQKTMTFWINCTANLHFLLVETKINLSNYQNSKLICDRRSQDRVIITPCSRPFSMLCSDLGPTNRILQRLTTSPDFRPATFYFLTLCQQTSCALPIVLKDPKFSVSIENFNQKSTKDGARWWNTEYHTVGFIND